MVTGLIPVSYLEPIFSRVYIEVSFIYFINDDNRRADSFLKLLDYLYYYYFPYLVWSRFILNPTKSIFFNSEINLLGFTKIREGVRLSKDKIVIIRDYPSLKDEEELNRFLYILPYIRGHLPKRTDYSIIMKSVIIYEIRLVKIKEKMINKYYYTYFE